MTLEQLRIFVAVAKHEHVTRAAGELNLTQSAVSAAVAALEERHATRLFDRIGRRIALTRAGRTFLVEARAVLARAAEAEAVLADLAGMKRGSLALAASQTVGNYWLPPLLQAYRAAYPGIAVSLAIGNTTTVSAMVRDGSVDLGFVEDVVDDPLLPVEPVATDDLVAVVAPVLAPAHRPPSAGDLAALPWVLREAGSGTRAMAASALSAVGVDIARLDVILELPSNEAVRSAVESGAGAAILSSLVVAGALQAGTLLALDLVLPTRRFASIRHRERHVTRAEQAFHGLIGRLGGIS